MTRLDSADVPTLVDVASRVIPATWGLDTFVAVNPLHGFEELPFEEAAVRAADLFDARAYAPLGRLRARYEAGAVGEDHVKRAIHERRTTLGAAVADPDAFAWHLDDDRDGGARRRPGPGGGRRPNCCVMGPAPWPT